MKILSILLVISLVFGFNFSSTVKALSNTIGIFENNLTKVSDLFGIDVFSGVADVTPDKDLPYEDWFDLGYYEFSGEILPVWGYINGIVGHSLAESDLYVESVSPNMYNIRYREGSYFVTDPCIRLNVFGTWGVYPIEGYIYYVLESETAFFSMSYLTGVKPVTLGSGFFDRLSVILPNLTSGVQVWQSEVTVNEYINANID